MEKLINKQIKETKEYEIAEIEYKMELDPRYHLFGAIEKLTVAQDRLFHNGDHRTKDFVDVALLRAKEALKILEK